jgi:hypothetical protein
MTVYVIFKSINAFFVVVVVGVGGIAVCFNVIRHEVATEKDFHRRYGEEWKVEYEQMYGSVAQAQTRVGIGAVGIIGIFASGIWLVRVLKKGLSQRSQPSKRQKSDESRGERRVRYKRNALLGVYFGIPGILFSILLAIFRMGIFADHSNEVTLAIFIFMGSYCAVVSGCYWWVKAKHWSEAVVSIAFMPLAVFLIPFVRILVLREIGLLITAMVMAPLILVVVVAVLPDKSGHQRRRATWEKRD